jgi:hypothetical protein
MSLPEESPGAGGVFRQTLTTGAPRARFHPRCQRTPAGAGGVFRQILTSGVPRGAFSCRCQRRALGPAGSSVKTSPTGSLRSPPDLPQMK